MGNLTDERKAQILDKLALRADLGESDRIPLTGPAGEDIGDEYWVVLREANAEQISRLESLFMKETVHREIKDDGTLDELIERRYDTFGLLREVVVMRLIKDARLPRRTSSGIEAVAWPRQSSEQRKMLNEVPPALLGVLFRAINDFYFGEETIAVESESGELEAVLDQQAVVGELKNLPG